MEAPVLQRRPLPKLNNNADVEVKSPYRKINKVQKAKHLYNHTDDNDYYEIIQELGKQGFVDPCCIKAKGPDPFPQRKPKLLPKINRVPTVDDVDDVKFINSAFISPSDIDFDYYPDYNLYIPELPVYSNELNYIYELAEKDILNTSIPELHLQNLNDNDRVPNFERRKPWRIMLLEQQFRDHCKNNMVESRNQHRSEENVTTMASRVMKNMDFSPEVELEEKRKTLRMDNACMVEDEGSLPTVSSFKVSKTVVKLTDEQLRSLAMLISESTLINIDKTDKENAPKKEGNMIFDEDANKMNLKAFFLNVLPNIPQTSFLSLTWVNLSFNNFKTFPDQLYLLTNMVSLNMRNNPLSSISKGIKKLKKLKYLNFSFCLLTKIDKSIYLLKNLEVLDLSYNLIKLVHKDIENLTSLLELYIEGNMISVFPRSILKLNLVSLFCKSNFIHKVFWKESCPPSPQTLADIAMTTLVKKKLLHFVPGNFKDYYISDITCVWCSNRIAGKGVPVLKPVVEIFGVKNLPLLFHVCSQNCRVELQLAEELPNALAE